MKRLKSRSTLRIAQVAPLYESVPPKLYGGTERVVSYLTEELVRMGHDVTLFASGDSQTSARLVNTSARALRLAGCHDPILSHNLMLEHVTQRATDFDVIHYHLEFLHLPIASRQSATHLTTLHGRLDLPEVGQLFAWYPDAPLVSISDSQRSDLPSGNWIGTVHHGLPLDLLCSGDGSGGYLAFVGRISPEKRPDRAIEIARRTGIPLKLAAKVDDKDRAYFEREIRPLLDPPQIDYIGEIGETEKCKFLGAARALLFPIDWPEPFGLVMIESMACGTPVIAFGCGSVPEIIDDGISGFIVSSVDDAVQAVGKLTPALRTSCRRAFEQRFSAARMAEDYVQLYESLLGTTHMTRSPLLKSAI